MRKLWIAALACLGLGITGYLTYEKLLNPNGALCGPNGGCSIVLSSPYASVGGLPLASLGGGLYLLILICALGPDSWKRGLWILTTSGFAFSLYLMALLAFELKALCPFCLGSALTMTSLWLTMLLTDKDSRSRAGLTTGIAVASLTLVGALSLHEVQKNTAPPPPPNFGIGLR